MNRETPFPTRNFLLLPFLCALFLAFSSTGAFAAKRTCDQSDTGERVKCKTENMGDELDTAVTLLTGDDADFLSPTQKENLRKARDRARNAAARPDPGEYKRLTRKLDPDCYVAEYVSTDDPPDPEDDGDNDGVCITKGPDKEICLEVVGDQIGDEDGKCEVLHAGGKPVQEACVRICDQETVDADEGNFDAGVAEDLEQGIEDTTEALTVMNQEVTAYIAVRQAAALLGEGEGTSGACDNLLSGTMQRQFTFAESEGIQAGATAAKLAADTCRDYCGQTSFGWNCRGLCTFFSVAENVLQAVADGVNLQDGNVDSERIDAAASCLETLGDKLNALDEKLDTVIRLLNTPQGRRPAFPTKP